MKTNDGRKLPPGALEYARKRAVELFEQGYKRIKIAEILGVNHNTVGTWIKKYQESGSDALVSKKRGRKLGSGRRLTPDQEETIQEIIYDKMPDQLKLPFALWTRKAIQTLIKEQFDIDLPKRTINHYLERWDFTPQRPIKRAYEQNPKKLQKWLDSTFPDIKERASAENAEIHWGDETGVSNDCHYGRSYAPKGKTPVIRRNAQRFSISMISSITRRGKTRFMCYQGAMNSQIFLRFLKRLKRDSSKKVFLIVDNLRVHHSKPVTQWLEDNFEYIELFFLPPYSPQHNPDEYLNRDLKQSIANKPPARNENQLKQQIVSHMKSIQKLPNRVKTYFKNPNVAYAK